ncbi:DUF5956 family protein [Actinomycetes bacterium M1A6_2h]
MNQYWGDYPLADIDGEIPEGLPSGAYVPVIPTAHGALTAWAAGPGRSYRTHYPASAHPPVRVVYGPPGEEPTRVEEVPYTDTDLGDQNDAVNAYLTDAGVRPQPRGYRWHVLVPPSITTGEELDNALREKNLHIEPTEVRKIITRLYSELVETLQ